MVDALAKWAKHPAVSITVGTAAVAAGGVTVAYRACERAPVVGPLLRRGRFDLTRRGELVVERAVEPVTALVAAVAVEVVNLVLDELDLSELVRQRVDLVGLANEIIDGVDLPAIIRNSTATVTADVMTDVRSQGERADDAVSGIVDRILGRDRNDPS